MLGVRLAQSPELGPGCVRCQCPTVAVKLVRQRHAGRGVSLHLVHDDPMARSPGGHVLGP
jgi:hypothetical protein